jgi:glycerophosphoryl diester phosphodiesterase
MWVIAHRGASGVAPENTLTAFRRAVELGAAFIETDLQLSRDARLVALHDELLERTTDGQGAVSVKTLADLRQLDAGAWFPADAVQRDVAISGSVRGPVRRGTFAGERIPTVEEVLSFGRDQDVGLYLELKPTGPSGAEQTLVGALRAADEIGRSVVICFQLSSLLQLRRLEPMLVTGYLYDEEIADAPARAVEAGARQILPRADRITAGLVRDAHRLDLKLVAWTVNDVGRMKELIGLGVDGIITDYPDRLVGLLESK